MTPGWVESAIAGPSVRPRAAGLSVAIPTYRRDEPLLETLRSLLAGDALPEEVLVVDQTEAHAPGTEAALAALAAAGAIRRIAHAPPSASGARNRALLEARGDVVLFLDDDVTCDPGLVAAHARHFADPSVVAVAGRIAQPRFPRPAHPFYLRISPSGRVLGNFDFDRPCDAPTAPGGNIAVRRAAAVAVGGFDERFVRVATYEDLDFGLRLARLGRIVYDPAARLVHHVAPRGGTRAGYRSPLPHLRDNFRNDALFFLRHQPAWRVPLYLARQVVVVARVAAGRYERNFPDLPRGPAALPLAAAGVAMGVLAGAGAWLRARLADGPTPRGSLPAGAPGHRQPA